MEKDMFKFKPILRLPGNVLKMVLHSLKPDLEHRPVTPASITVYGGETIDQRAPIVNQIRTHEED